MCILFFLFFILFSDRNQIARLVNSACTLPTAALTPLVNSKTGDRIAQFPDNVAVINAMACEFFLL
jgi:hypothetical protein